MTICNPGMRALATGLAIAVAAFAASFAGAEGKRDEKPTEQPPPEVVEPVASPIGATDAALRESFKEYVGLRISGEKTVFLTFAKGANLDAAANLAREVWVKAAGDGGRRLPHFEFVESVATPEQLHSTFVKMRDVLTLKHVVFLDLDEACGCISVGVENDAAAEQVASFTGNQGISQDWVQTVVTPRIVMQQMPPTLWSHFRPTMGGVQILFPSGNSMISTCSMGLPTYSWTTASFGFLTASHCTRGPRGQNLHTEFFQGIVTLVDRIGEEKLDSPMFGTGANAACPTGRECRFSDVAFVEYTQQTLGITGRVKRPAVTCVGIVPCGLNVARPTDDIRMIDRNLGLFTGMDIDKVGRTTGWTRGPITRTCAHTGVADTNVTLLCQYLVDMASGGGDSGGSVFAFNPTTMGGSFAGVHWGGPDDGSSSVFSPIDGIQKDLGVFVYNQTGVSGAFSSSGRLYTSNVDDELEVMIERNVVSPGAVEFVLSLGPGISAPKEIVLAEGAATGGRWTIAVDSRTRRSVNGLWTSQLPGGVIEFRKEIWLSMQEVSRLPLDSIPGGTRLTFTWRAD